MHKPYSCVHKIENLKKTNRDAVQMIMQADPVRFLLQNIKITSRGGEILSLLQKENTSLL